MQCNYFLISSNILIFTLWWNVPQFRAISCSLLFQNFLCDSLFSQTMYLYLFWSTRGKKQLKNNIDLLPRKSLNIWSWWMFFFLLFVFVHFWFPENVTWDQCVFLHRGDSSKMGTKFLTFSFGLVPCYSIATATVKKTPTFFLLPTSRTLFF